ncbi:MAG: hypothetical protein ACREEM_21365 [Blastocatellia bacterium]
MKRSFIALCLCWSLVLSVTRVIAQDANATTMGGSQDWEVVRQLLTGEKVQIEKKDGKKLTGVKAGATDVELYIERKGKTVDLKREEVRRVWRVAPPSRKKQWLFGGIGAGVGLAAGLGIATGLALKQCGGSCTGEGVGIVAAIVGLPAGGAVAGVTLAGDGKRTLLYTAP